MKFIFSKQFLLNVVLAFVLFLVGIFLTNIFLKSYTHKGESITVPDLREMVLKQATEMLNDKKLRFQVSDSSYSADLPPFAILDQNPKPGQNVKENRTIYLSVNAKTPPEREVPDLAGKSSYRSAKINLEGKGFKLGELIYKPHPDKNAILDVLFEGKSVKKGTNLPLGSKIDLVIGNGLSRDKVEVPDLTGLTLKEADFSIKGNSLNIGSVIFDETVVDTNTAVVYKQIPGAYEGSLLKMGEPIDIFITQKLGSFSKLDSLYREGDDSMY